MSACSAWMGCLKYSTTKRWADYLVNNTLQSQNQYVIVFLEVNEGIGLMEVFRTNYDVSSASSANIALKGIFGIRAMAEIAHAVGKDTDAMQYRVSCTQLWIFCVVQGD